MKKAEILTHWRDLPVNQQLAPCPIAYKHEGSTYTEDGLRITGSREWIDNVLSRLKDLLSFENTTTRLSLNYQESKDRETGRAMGSYNCYIQVHQRGGQAQMANAFASALAGREVIASRGY